MVGTMTTLAQQIAKARADLLDEIERFQAKHDMPDSTFGRLAMGDPAFLYEYRKGRKPGLETMDALSVFMKAYRPLKRRQASVNVAA